MSGDGPPASWPPGPRSPGRLCRVCGAPLRDGASACPACGIAADGPTSPPQLMTPFGHGLCGFIGVLMAGWALSLIVPAAAPRALVGPAPMALAALAAATAAQLGRRLLPQWRCAYEHLLIAGMVGGPCILMAALAGLTNLESLALVWLAAVTVTYLLMRRYGYRAGDVR